MADDDDNTRETRSSLRISKSTVDAAPLPPAGRRLMIWDTEIKGFGVRITSAGVKTYILRYRMGGRSAPIRMVTIGQHGSPFTAEQARRHASELLLAVRSGTDIVAERAAARERHKADESRHKDRLFDRVAEDWFRKHVERNGLRSAKDIRGVLDRDLKPAFAGKTIDGITKADVTKALDALGERSGAGANKAHKWARQLFNWLVDRGAVGHSPMLGIKKPFPEGSRTRVLGLGEIVVLWIALDDLPEPFRSFYRLLILLGQRLREVSNAPWSEFDFEADEWLIPETRTKSGRDHLVPLPDQALDILTAAQPDPKRRAGLVFTTNGKTGISGFSKMKEAIDAAMAKLIAENDFARDLVGGSVAPWVVHDLRRSVATGCQALGVDLMHSEAVLNHSLGKKASGVAGVYHLYEYYTEKAEALARWGELVETAVSLFRAGDLDGLRQLDPARRARAARRRPRRPSE